GLDRNALRTTGLADGQRGDVADDFARIQYEPCASPLAVVERDRAGSFGFDTPRHEHERDAAQAQDARQADHVGVHGDGAHPGRRLEPGFEVLLQIEEQSPEHALRPGENLVAGPTDARSPPPVADRLPGRGRLPRIEYLLP